MAESSKQTGRRWWVWLRRALVAGGLLAVLGVGALAIGYKLYVVDDPGEHISRDYILRRIARESPVYYRDGESKIGVFFGDEHRQYVTFAELPTDYVNAIVAAEDKRFWHHPGFDLLGFGRAMLGNLKNRKLIGGGSTITSQTAKNLYDRKGRTLKPKLIEVLNAFRLEAHYSKEEILEFYVNQFHVYGNGRGLGVAARYFFDKDVSELGTLECAFLAGVVKGPSLYNPFVGSDEAARARARQRAEDRVDYVLDRLAAEGYLDPERAKALKAESLPFRQGKFRFEQNVILDYIYEQLQGEPFASIFEEHGIEDPARAGLQIITTIDQDYQAAAEYGLRHNLTEIGAQLEGHTIADFFSEPEGGIRPVRPEQITQHGFFVGRVAEVLKEGEGAPAVKVDLGGVIGVVDKAGLKRVATVLLKGANKDRYAQSKAAELNALLDGCTVGAQVWVSVREAASGDKPPQLDLELVVDLQGAVVVLERGELRAMVGGSDNRNYNRVTTAKRQLGSTYKSLVYAAAMSLGWRATDPLDNSRQGFPFQSQSLYWPRADHTPDSEIVSLAYSGVSSENLAAVWLLYHMTDPLTGEQRLDLARRLGLAPTANEGDKAYLRRIRDEWGVIPTETSLREGLYEEALGEIWPDLVFGGQLVGDGWGLKTLPYGRGFAEERARLAKARLSSKETSVRAKALSRSFLDLEAASVRGRSKLRQVLAGQAPPAGFYRWVDDGKTWLIYSESGAEAGWLPLGSGAEARAILTASGGEVIEPEGEAVEIVPTDEDSAYEDPNKGGQGSAARDPAVEGRRRLLKGAVQQALSAIGVGVGVVVDPAERINEGLLIEGVTTPAVLDRLREEIERRYATMQSLPLYDLQRLVRDRDFRVLLGLQYTVGLAQMVGIHSEMKPVLSMALGSNETTLLEAAMLYQTFLDGKVYTFGAADAQTSILREIRDVDGSVLWRATSGWKQILDPRVAASTGRLLRGVVERGTGRSINEAVLVTSPDPERQKEIAPFRALVPLAGKTGTTNDYINAAFVGFVPTASAGADVPTRAVPWGNAITVASYVGYDDNTPMTSGNIRIAGASGALPVWLDATVGIVNAMDLSRSLDLVDLAFEGGGVLPIQWPAGMTSVVVNSVTGLQTGADVVSPEELAPGQALYDVFLDPSTGKEISRYAPVQMPGPR